jgi:hypothetical protein
MFLGAILINLLKYKTCRPALNTAPMKTQLFSTLILLAVTSSSFGQGAKESSTESTEKEQSASSYGQTVSYQPLAVNNEYISVNKYEPVNPAETEPSDSSAANGPAAATRTGYVRANSNRVRFNPANGGTYCYTGTPYTWDRCHKRQPDSISKAGFLQPIYLSYNNDPTFQLAACMEDFNYYTLLRSYDASRPRLVMFSHDGYIVYKKDTMPGIVTFTNREVQLENTNPKDRHRAYGAQLSDPFLKEIVLYRGPEELHMSRATAKEKRLWRVLHTGKLNIYDKQYKFITAKNIDIRSLRIKYGALRMQKIRSKTQFVHALNRTYKLRLNADKYDWKELFDIVAGLN